MARHVFRVVDIRRIAPDIARRTEALHAAHRKASFDAAGPTLRRVVKKSPVDTGLFKSSWQIATELSRNGQENVVIRNDAPHAGVVEGGARPHWPPLQPLVEWVERNAAKLGFVNPRRFRGRASLTAEQKAHAYQIARAIQAKIARQGQKPTHIMRSEIPFARRTLKKALDRYLDEIAGSPMR